MIWKRCTLTLRLVMTRGSAAQWKLALRYALPIANTSFGLRWGPRC